MSLSPLSGPELAPASLAERQDQHLHFPSFSRVIDARLIAVVLAMKDVLEQAGAGPGLYRFAGDGREYAVGRVGREHLDLPIVGRIGAVAARKDLGRKVIDASTARRPAAIRTGRPRYVEEIRRGHRRCGMHEH